METAILEGSASVKSLGVYECRSGSRTADKVGKKDKQMEELKPKDWNKTKVEVSERKKTPSLNLVVHIFKMREERVAGKGFRDMPGI